VSVTGFENLVLPVRRLCSLLATAYFKQLVDTAYNSCLRVLRPGIAMQVSDALTSCGVLRPLMKCVCVAVCRRGSWTTCLKVQRGADHQTM
jgi:hypothetical protein